MTAIEKPTDKSIEGSGQEFEMQRCREWIGRAADVCERAATGDLEARLLGLEDADAETRRLGTAVNRLLDLTDAFLREARAALGAAGEGRFYRRVILRGLPGSFRVSSEMLNEASAGIERQSRALAAAEARRFGMADEFESRVKAVSDRVSASAGELRLTAQSLAASAEKTTEKSSEVAESSSETSNSVQEVASATEQLTAEVREVERRTRESAASAENAVKTANAAKDVMVELAAASERIGRVVKLISEIAKQTNLLALNAAIEAARSGEAGKGFAVVASEVKALASQTTQATDEITDEIESIQRCTQQMNRSVGALSETIRDASESARSIAESVDQQRLATLEISRSGQKAAEGVKQVSAGILVVSDEAAEASRNAAQLLTSADLLSGDAGSLEQAVESFLSEIRSKKQS